MYNIKDKDRRRLNTFFEQIYIFKSHTFPSKPISARPTHLNVFKSART